MTSESSEKFITMLVLKEMLEIHERAYRTTMQLMMDSVKDDIKLLKQSVDEMKQSLHYSQKDIDDVKTKIEKIEEKTKNVDKSIANSQMDIEDLYNEQEYLENQSRRNNVKVLGIPEKNEKDGIETWDECEERVKEEIKAKLGIKTELIIERAHRVGRKRPHSRHLENGSKITSKPRPIVARFAFWKQKDQVIRAARESKPKDIQFLEDYSKKTLEKRRELIPELIAERKKGRRAFLVMDRLVVTDRSKPPDGHGIVDGQ